MSELVSPPSEAPIPHDPDTVPGQEPVRAGIPVQAATTRPGTMLGGRYRLTVRVGIDPAAGAEFWRAEDTVLQRDVAVTVLRRIGGEPGHEDVGWSERATDMVTRALRAGSFEHRGSARLLDVLSPDGESLPRDVVGVAVTEWVHGMSLAEAVANGLLKPLTAARAVAPLAAAVESAHQRGLVLGIDHPQRVRISTDGRAQVGFAMPRHDAEAADDVRGLGAVLYTLLTAQWPLARTDAARAGLAPAERTSGSVPVAPSTRRPGVPVELDTLTEGTLGHADSPGHIHTAASVHALLTDVVAEDDRAALLPPAPDGVPADPDDVWQDTSLPPVVPDPRRKRKLAIGIAALAIAMIGVLGFVGAQIGSLFSRNPAPVIVVAEPPAPGAPPAAGARPNELVKAVGASVFDVDGTGDDVEHVSRVIDGDPTTSWRTADYKQQFPAFKPGTGVLLSFASAVQLADLNIVSPSAGAVVEVRSAATSDPKLADTAVIGTAKLTAGTTTVSLAGSQPVTHVLVWITKLSGPDGANSAELDEVRFHRAGG